MKFLFALFLVLGFFYLIGTSNGDFTNQDVEDSISNLYHDATDWVVSQ